MGGLTEGSPEMNEQLQLAVTAEMKVATDLIERGLGIAWPSGHGHPFDLILIRPDASLERVQVKHARSDGRTLLVKCHSSSEWVYYSYDPEMVDWIAAWDETTDTCYYLPIEEATKSYATLRLDETQNGQKVGIRWAKDYTEI
jgi:hypothetical protein